MASLFDNTGTDSIEDIAREQLAVVADLGNGSKDISCHAFRFIADDKHHTIPRLTETILGTQTSRDVQKLTERFKQELIQRGGVRDLYFSDFQGSDSEALEVFVMNFDASKGQYNPEDDRGFEFRLRFGTPIRLIPVNSTDVATIDNQVEISANMMHRIFDPWLAEVIRMLEKCVDDVKREWSQTAPIVIALSGSGLPFYVKATLKLHFEKSDRIRVIIGDRKSRLTWPRVALRWEWLTGSARH
ncbi:hypothetical protein LTR99_009505 [Exophiala xenobiotica]|uniref:SMODS-associated and fused to various effectors domain-containing protein n=1 Tax=Vermiconidia calcicola TaxID=1690605 RepID=A0AAV9PZ67_9PEZI|nr:hypothetical protein H2202_001721 [Exophiala xenobiotica]KAK5530820.1 hypothetical protein LTR25_008677 [Vermiconidia calcicola]KAK5531215.1 hypothetical protein LTR23_009982 [Chaetothyriales sp. CCFEE 6169]KAK5228361.1 hypothetical protein LTR72_002244 [Exophiala xenobiotica]KAK5268937.1 hypothetical protein LTR96_005721 [Exophiala xenobiotica]